MINFRRAEAVDVDLRKVALDVAQQFFVPLELELRMQAALHQNLIAAELDRFLNLLQQLVALEHVAFRMLRRAIERAEIADRRADVRVVDVAIDVVGANRLRMQPPRDGVGGAAERRQIVRFEQPHAFVRRKPLAGDGFIENRLNRHAGNHGSQSLS